MKSRDVQKTEKSRKTPVLNDQIMHKLHSHCTVNLWTHPAKTSERTAANYIFSHY